MLEFIDWGGGDILHHASRYMADATGEDRFEAPEIIGRNMEEGRIGLRTGQGFLDYEGMDVPAYRLELIPEQVPDMDETLTRLRQYVEVSEQEVKRFRQANRRRRACASPRSTASRPTPH